MSQTLYTFPYDQGKLSSPYLGLNTRISKRHYSCFVNFTKVRAQLYQFYSDWRCN